MLSVFLCKHARGPKFRLSTPVKKLGVAASACDPCAGGGGVEIGPSVGLTGQGEYLW